MAGVAQPPAEVVRLGVTEETRPDARVGAEGLLSSLLGDDVVRRRRVVRLDLDALDAFDVPAAASPGAAVEVELFEGEPLVVTGNRVERDVSASGTHTYWHGTMNGADGTERGTVNVTVLNGVVSGEVLLYGRARYRLQSVSAAGGVLVAELDEETTFEEPQRPGLPEDGASRSVADPDGGSVEPAEPDASGSGAPGQAEAAASSGPTVRVLNVYTPAMVGLFGTNAAVEAFMQAAIDYTNTAYANSGVAHRVATAGFLRTWHYNTPEDMGPGLDRVRNKGDGVMDEVHLYRDLTGADLVVLWHDFSDGCGLGRQLGPDFSFGSFNFEAFSVLDPASGCSSFRTTAHETGHNLGAQHNPEDEDATPAFPYANGHRKCSGSNRFRTVMAYDTNCPGTTEIQYFSTPNRTWNGQPVGIADQRDNARAFGGTDNTAATFRFSGADRVGIADRIGGAGYWTVSSSGKVRAYGGAPHHGDADTEGITLSAPIVDIAADRDGAGYYLVAADGGVFGFAATFRGSMGGQALEEPIVGMATDPDGAGYWLVAADGGVFSFSAQFSGSAGNQNLVSPVVAMAADADGTGYWMVAQDGGVFSYAADYQGRPANPDQVVSITSPATDKYWILDSKGEVYSYGGLANHGDCTSSCGATAEAVDIVHRGSGSYLIVRRVGSVVVLP